MGGSESKYLLSFFAAEASDPLNDRTECVGAMFPGSHSNSPRISYRGSFTTATTTSSDWLHSPSSSEKTLLTPLIGSHLMGTSSATPTPPPVATPPQQQHYDATEHQQQQQQDLLLEQFAVAVSQQQFDPVSFGLKQQSPSYSTSSSTTTELMGVPPEEMVYHRSSPSTSKYQWTTTSAAPTDLASILVPKMEPVAEEVGSACSGATATTMLLSNAQSSASLAEYNQSTSKVTYWVYYFCFQN